MLTFKSELDCTPMAGQVRLVRCGGGTPVFLRLRDPQNRTVARVTPPSI
jgi:hypothetical protein